MAREHHHRLHQEPLPGCAPAGADARLPEGVEKVQVRARGLDRNISPVGHTWSDFFQNGPRVSDDFMAVRADRQ